MRHLLILAALLIASPAHAWDSDPQAPKRIAHKARPKAPAVKAYVQREPEKTCLKPVAVVGSQWATESGAEDSARKAWAESVRFHSGEAFMDLTHANGYARRCARSSIGEVVGQTLHRCEVSAVPCKPGFDKDK